MNITDFGTGFFEVKPTHLGSLLIMDSFQNKDFCDFIRQIELQENAQFVQILSWADETPRLIFRRFP